MEAIRYNGNVGAIAYNNHGDWTIKEWCPKHADADAGEAEKKCYCTRAIGDGPDQVPEAAAKAYIKLGQFERISLDELSDPLD